MARQWNQQKFAEWQQRLRRRRCCHGAKKFRGLMPGSGPTILIQALHSGNTSTVLWPCGGIVARGSRAERKGPVL